MIILLRILAPSICLVSSPGGQSGIGKKVANGKSSRIKQFNTPTLHAEVDAYQNLRGYYRGKELDLFVVRFSNHGDLCSSRPCYNCLKTLTNSGLRIRYVYYSNNGEIVKEKFDEMIDSEQTTVSSGMRMINRARNDSPTSSNSSNSPQISPRKITFARLPVGR
jgi:deoxycytidylate deaminase